MKLVNDKVFLDTNIIIYSYSLTEPKKRIIARRFISESNSFISTQVLTELCNTVVKKLEFDYSIALKVLNECCANNKLIINTKDIIAEATNIADRYGFSFYDSLIVSSALNAGCQMLYSEDMQHNQLIEKKLIVFNPFL